MTDQPVRRGRRAHRGRVVRTERLTPHMIRVTLGGDGLADFHMGDYTDHYVKLQFGPAGVVYPEPYDVEVIRETLPREQWPSNRTYTVRAWDPEARELTIDFVYHGDEGLAGPWAANAQAGDDIYFMGPGGGYAPSQDAAWHLLVGDESALPAIAAALEHIPAEVPAYVFVEIEGPAEEQVLETSAKAEITWLHRGSSPVGEKLLRAVRDLEFPSSDVHAFVHGEAGFVKDLRRHLRVDRGIPLDRLSISGYWRLGVDDEGWRAVKRDWNRQVEEEEARATGAA